ncbi:unnamed protein product [Rotaria sp. Silwood2]|nr:unnamed protein product [Rotaria sp. Silwood2]CAF4557262.1 unnamed protein product [Rotaria sp. Silwood2]
MSKYKEALLDIQFIETHQRLSDSLLVIKCKSTLHTEASKLRDLLKSSIGLNLLDNKDHMNFYNALSLKNIDNIIGRMFK